MPKEPERPKRVGPQPVKPLLQQGNTLQVVANPDTPNDPLSKLEDATLEAWLVEEAQRIDSMSESEWLGILLGGFLVDKIFRKPKKKKEEKLQASSLSRCRMARAASPRIARGIKERLARAKHL